MKKVLIIINSTSLIIVFYFFFLYIPFIMDNSYTLQDFRNYFAIVSAFSGFIITLSGLGLGLFYYFHKLKTEDRSQKTNIQRQRIKILLDELKNYDKYVSQILNKNFENEKMLSSLRDNIRRSFENIVIVIGLLESSTDFSKKDLRAILNVNSFVDNSNIIMLQSYDEFDTCNTSEIYDLYIEKLKVAKNICVQRAH